MSTPAPALVTRSAWGAKPYKGSPTPMKTANRIVVHYSAGALAPDLPAGKTRVRDIQKDHQENPQKKWADIGYHFLIDSAGHVYQGRPFLDAKPFASRPTLALGSHVKKQNSGKIGVCLLGCFHPSYTAMPCTDAVPTAMMEATVGLISFLCRAYEVLPEHIKGHRDFLATSCPGDTLYAALPSIRARVAARLAASAEKAPGVAAVAGPEDVPRNHVTAGSRWYSLAADGPSRRLSEHFRLGEFACRDGTDAVLVHPAMVRLLEALRAAAGGMPIHVNSGYRTPEYNRAIRGAKHSRHVMGLAADVTVRGLSPAAVHSLAKNLNPGGLGRYDSFTHLDVEGAGRRWDGP